MSKVFSDPGLSGKKPGHMSYPAVSKSVMKAVHYVASSTRSLWKNVNIFCLGGKFLHTHRADLPGNGSDISQTEDSFVWFLKCVNYSQKKKKKMFFTFLAADKWKKRLNCYFYFSTDSKNKFFHCKQSQEKKKCFKSESNIDSSAYDTKILSGIAKFNIEIRLANFFLFLILYIYKNPFSF